MTRRNRRAMDRTDKLSARNWARFGGAFLCVIPVQSCRDKSGLEGKLIDKAIAVNGLKLRPIAVWGTSRHWLWLDCKSVYSGSIPLPASNGSDAALLLQGRL